MNLPPIQDIKCGKSILLSIHIVIARELSYIIRKNIRIKVFLTVCRLLTSGQASCMCQQHEKERSKTRPFFFFTLGSRCGQIDTLPTPTLPKLRSA